MPLLTLPHYPLAFWLVATLAIIILGVDKAGFGGGVGVVAAPLIALTIPVPATAALLMPILIIADLFALRSHYRNYDRRLLLIMLPGVLLGILLGALAFTYFSQHARWLRVGVGVMSLLFVIFQVGRELILGALSKSRPPAALGALLGGLAAFGSTLIHAGGPFAVIYLLPQQLPRERFVGTMVVLFALINWLKLIPYAWLGLLRVGDLGTVLLFTPVIIASVGLGIWLNKRFSNLWFHRVVYGLLSVTSLQLIFG